LVWRFSFLAACVLVQRRASLSGASRWFAHEVRAKRYPAAGAIEKSCEPFGLRLFSLGFVGCVSRTSERANLFRAGLRCDNKDHGGKSSFSKSDAGIF